MSAPTLTFSPAMFHAAHVARLKTVTRRFLAGHEMVDNTKLFTDLRLKTSVVRGKQRLRAAATHLRSGVTLDFGPPAHRPGETKPMVTTWAVHKNLDSIKPSKLLPSGQTIWFDDGSPKPSWAGKSRPARFLPKTLYHLAPQCRIESARPEPLHAITEADALAEGITRRAVRQDAPRDEYGVQLATGTLHLPAIGPIAAYFRLWDSLHPDHPAHTNPIVWRYQFSAL